MLRRVAYLAAITGIVVAVAGCLGPAPFERRDAWRDKAERACMRNTEVSASAWVEQVSEINGRGACGVDKPLKVSALADGSISIGPTPTIGCPMTAALEGWVRDAVQPAALAWFGMPVTELKQISAYYCRTKNSVHGASLSEHAFGNALDISGFVLMDGRTITVLKGWKGAEDERGFLREVFAHGCSHFTTTLGPGVKYHSNHFHFDLAHHKGGSSYCRPKLDEPPVRPPYAGGMLMANRGPMDIMPSTAGMPAPQSPVYAPAPAYPASPAPVYSAPPRPAYPDPMLTARTQYPPPASNPPAAYPAPSAYPPAAYPAPSSYPPATYPPAAYPAHSAYPPATYPPAPAQYPDQAYGNSDYPDLGPAAAYPEGGQPAGATPGGAYGFHRLPPAEVPMGYAQ